MTPNMDEKRLKELERQLKLFIGNTSTPYSCGFMAQQILFALDELDRKDTEENWNP